MIKETLGRYNNISSGIGRKEYQFNPVKSLPFVKLKKAQNIPEVYYDDDITSHIVNQLANDTYANQIKENFENIGFVPKISNIVSVHTNGLKRQGFEKLSSVISSAKQVKQNNSFYKPKKPVIYIKTVSDTDSDSDTEMGEPDTFNNFKRRPSLAKNVIPQKRRPSLKENGSQKKYIKEKSVFITPKKRNDKIVDTPSKKFKKDFIYNQTTSRTIGIQGDVANIKKGRRPKAKQSNPSLLDEKATQTE